MIVRLILLLGADGLPGELHIQCIAKRLFISKRLLIPHWKLRWPIRQHHRLPSFLVVWHLQHIRIKLHWVLVFQECTIDFPSSAEFQLEASYRRNQIPSKIPSTHQFCLELRSYLELCSFWWITAKAVLTAFWLRNNCLQLRWRFLQPRFWSHQVDFAASIHAKIQSTLIRWKWLVVHPYPSSKRTILTFLTLIADSQHKFNAFFIALQI